MKAEYFKMVLAIYLYNLTGNVPKENLIMNIMQNIHKQIGQTEIDTILAESKERFNIAKL